MTGIAAEKRVDAVLDLPNLLLLTPLSLLLLDSPQPVRGSSVSNHLGLSHGHAIIVPSHANTKVQSWGFRLYKLPLGNQIDPLAFPFQSQFRYLEPI